MIIYWVIAVCRIVSWFLLPDERAACIPTVNEWCSNECWRD